MVHYSCIASIRASFCFIALLTPKLQSSQGSKKVVGKKKSVKKKCGAETKIVRPAYIKMDEFEATPKYIKGRLTQDQVNVAVDALFDALTAKYAVASKKRTKIPDHQMAMWTAFKDAETNETKGKAFIVDDDIRNLTKFKLDSAAGRQCIQVLRSLGRFTEVRGGGFTRYVFPN